jgi:hypothetical protein
MAQPKRYFLVEFTTATDREHPLVFKNLILLKSTMPGIMAEQARVTLPIRV